MRDAETEMREIFNALSEQNRDVLLLVAKGIKAVQDAEERKKMKRGEFKYG